MNNIYKALSMLDSGDITSSQTFSIDEALASARSEQIPAEDAPNVIDYIDIQLLYHEVSQEVRGGLTRLYDALLLRRGMA
jgi:hypothetical protein